MVQVEARELTTRASERQKKRVIYPFLAAEPEEIHAFWHGKGRWVSGQAGLF